MEKQIGTEFLVARTEGCARRRRHLGALEPGAADGPCEPCAARRRAGKYVRDYANTICGNYGNDY